jgi:hypothetical protein
MREEEEHDEYGEEEGAYYKKPADIGSGNVGEDNVCYRIACSFCGILDGEKGDDHTRGKENDGNKH